MTLKERIKSFNWYSGEIQGCAEFITDLLNSDTQNHIITANMELLALLRQDSNIADVCQKAKMVVPDGVGAVMYLKRNGLKEAHKIAGVELCPIILKMAHKKTRVFLFGSKEGVACLAARNLSKLHPHIDFVGYASGYNYIDSEIVEKISNSQADIVFVALGMPKQELWIGTNLAMLKNIKVAIGVGGSFDVWANTKKRAPMWMQKLNMEWVYRIFSDPFARLPRFAKTIIDFIKVYFSK